MGDNNFEMWHWPPPHRQERQHEGNEDELYPFSGQQDAATTGQLQYGLQRPQAPVQWPYQSEAHRTQPTQQPRQPSTLLPGHPFPALHAASNWRLNGQPVTAAHESWLRMRAYRTATHESLAVPSYTFEQQPIPEQQHHTFATGSLDATSRWLASLPSYQPNGNDYGYEQTSGLQQMPGMPPRDYGYVDFHNPQSYGQPHPPQQRYDTVTTRQSAPAGPGYLDDIFPQSQLGSTLASHSHEYQYLTQPRLPSVPNPQPMPAQNLSQPSAQTVITFAPDQQWFWNSDTRGLYDAPDGTPLNGTYGQIYGHNPQLREHLWELYHSVNDIGEETAASAAVDDEAAAAQQPPRRSEAYDLAQRVLAARQAREAAAETAKDEANDSVVAPTPVDAKGSGGVHWKDDDEEPDDYSDMVRQWNRPRPKKQPPPPNPACGLVRSIINGIRQEPLTLAELQAAHFTTPELRGALMVAVNEGITPRLPDPATKENGKVLGRWWRLQDVPVECVEVGRLWRQDVLRLIVECCQDVVKLRDDVKEKVNQEQ